MTPLRAGILGCGGIAHKHAQAMAALPDDVQLVAVADCSEPHARALSGQYTRGRAAVFADHHALLDRTALDLLVV